MLRTGDDRRHDQRGLAGHRNADALEADDGGDDQEAIGMDEMGNRWHEDGYPARSLIPTPNEKERLDTPEGFCAGETNRRPPGGSRRRLPRRSTRHSAALPCDDRL